MNTRLVIAASAALAIGVGLAASVSTLLGVLEHPGAAVAMEGIGVLFATLPFLVLGIGGAALASGSIAAQWRIPLELGWSALLAGLCLAGPLTGPYAWLFESATHASAAAWQATWTGISAWSGPGGIGIDLGMVRWPLLAGAAASAGLVLAPLSNAERVRERLVAAGRHLHLPRRNVPGGVAT